MDTKTCTMCKEVKSVEDFYFKVKAKGIRNSHCKACDAAKNKAYREANPERMKAAQERHRASGARRKWQLKATYGITPEDYDAMLAQQGGACAVCRSTTAGGRHPDTFHVDHNHETGAIRGLLCNNCNRAIGLMKDDPAVLLAAAGYLNS